MTLAAGRWTLTQRSVCAVVLGLGLALLVETIASRAAGRDLTDRPRALL